MNRRIGIVVSIAAMCSGLLAGFGAGPAQAVTPTVTRDPCLRGQWQMPAAESTRLLSQIAGLPGWAVTRGTITMSFNRGIQRYGSTLFIIEGDLGAQSFTMEASWINEAPYRTRAGKIVTTKDSPSDRITAEATSPAFNSAGR